MDVLGLARIRRIDQHRHLQDLLEVEAHLKHVGEEVDTRNLGDVTDVFMAIKPSPGIVQNLSVPQVDVSNPMP